MRNAFANTLHTLMKEDKDIILLTGDLGFSVFEAIIKDFPDQYINCGLTEQSMTGIAAGLASEGYIPIIYSIIPFITMRNFEQIRNDICYQNVPVKIVGVGAGFSYGPYGHTHHGIEDIGILRTVPNLTILAPGDPYEATELTKQMIKLQTPVYLRLGKKGEPTIHPSGTKVIVGKAITINEGSDCTLIATSNMLETAHIVVNKLKEKGIYTRLLSMHTLKPLDTEIIKESHLKTKAIFTLEEHSIIGGLGSAVSEVIAEQGSTIPFKRFAVPDRFTHTQGTQEHMRKANGLDVESITKGIFDIVNQK